MEENKIEKIMKSIGLLAEQFLKMMEFNNHLLKENLDLMKKLDKLKHGNKA